MSKGKGKPPAVQFYAGDFLNGTTYMTNAEVGLYIRLLCLQADQGPVPDDVNKISRVYGPEVPTLWDAVRAKFVEGPTPGTMVNVKMCQVVEAREAFRERQSAKGKASAESRSGSNSGSTTVEPNINHGSTTVEPKRDGDRVLTQERKERVREPRIIPLDMSEQMAAAIARWEQHRVEKRNKLTPSTREAFLKKCKAWGDLRAIAAIDHSIAQGWTGCYEPTQTTSHAQQTDEERRAERNRIIAERYPRG